ncbi:MAG: peptidase S8/S53 domain-containing protein [Piptocephalis tieghemiana]|nr:MAG: peptidase S8/S53 domain-containing protein [Piptocephalis tieghemiana]
MHIQASKLYFLLLLLPTITFSSAQFVKSAAERTNGRKIVILSESPGFVKMSATVQSATRTWSMNDDFHLMDGPLPDSVLNSLRERGIVAYEEDDAIVSIHQQDGSLPTNISITTQTGASWGLSRINQHKLNLDGIYNYPSSAGSGVNVYIVDTGIDFTNPEFGGRAKAGTTTISGYPSSFDSDDNGHGTFVAGIIGSSTYGVAKNVTLISVKALDNNGDGSVSDVLAGLSYVARQHEASPNKRTIVNLSLGTPSSQATNMAVAAIVKAGITVVVASGNGDARGNAQDACEFSPSSSKSVITVGATDRYDAAASFSNYGECVDILAPGVRVNSVIASAISTSPFSREVYPDGTSSGTSFASPYVSGVAALIMGVVGPISPDTIKSRLRNNATADLISNVGKGTPNLLVYGGGGYQPSSSLSSSSSFSSPILLITASLGMALVVHIILTL